MISMKLQGADKLALSINKTIESMEKSKMEPIVLWAANALRAEIRKAAPKGSTGNLKGGFIRKKLPRKTGYPVAAVVRPNYRRAPHAHLVEYGHGGPKPAGPHTYFWPTVEKHGPRLRNMMMEKLGRNIERAW